jgi:hypothetical protein
VLRENVEPGVRERAFENSRRYIAFADSSSGARDSFCLSLAHRDGERIRLALAREWKPPFDPINVFEEVATILRAYRVTQLHGDSYAVGFVQSTFKQLGINYKPSDLNRSEIYLTLLPMLMARNVVLLDQPKIISQLAQLQGRSGRDAVDHQRGGHDDLANAVAGSIVLAQQLRGGVDRSRPNYPLAVEIGYARLKKRGVYVGRSMQPPDRGPSSGRDPGRRVIFNDKGGSRDEIAS